MKRPDLDPRTIAWTLGALAAAGLVGAAAVVGLGLYNTSARAGHLPGVSWVLHTTFRNSVALRAEPASEVPALTDAMAALGARHFDAACRTCHSAPGYDATATMQSMVPHPPHIGDAVKDWTDAELHWILYAGVKMSGMPHWPADRPDEVWPTVAFLTRVQDGMDRDTYDDLVALDEPAADFDYCASCHGERGGTDNPHVPRLDILSESYLTAALDAYRTGQRDSGYMEHAASEVEADALPELARRFAAFDPSGGAVDGTGDVERGRDLAYASDGTRVPSCRACHGPWPEPIDRKFPSLAGQKKAYLVTQLKLWRDGARGGSRVAELMAQSAEHLTDADIDAVAAYYAAMAPATLDDTAE